MQKRIAAAICCLLCSLISTSVRANYVGMSDFDWPTYWEDHANDTAVTCAHIALANALSYWDQKFPDLIPADLGAPDSMEFPSADGTTYALQSFWNLMTALTAEQYLGSGDVGTADIGDGVKKWFADKKVGLSYHSTSGMEFTEKWDFYKKMVDKGEVPLVLLEMDSGNHWVTGVGYLENTLSIYDPNVIGKAAQTFDVTQKDDGWYIIYEGEEARIWSVQAVTATPEPATIFLFGSGLAFLAGKRARKKSRQLL